MLWDKLEEKDKNELSTYFASTETSIKEKQNMVEEKIKTIIPVIQNFEKSGE